MSSNWKLLKRKLTSVTVESSETLEKNKATKRKRTDISDSLKKTIEKNSAPIAPDGTAGQLPGHHLDESEKTKYVALDCEMVGIGFNGKQSALARCCIVDFNGEKIYDKFVRPKSFVTDFRTKYSGVRSADLRKGQAVTLEECMQQVASVISGKILVGHAIHNDLDVLMLSHHRTQIRDTATYKPYMRPHGKQGGKMRPRALKDLTRQHLGITIQDGEHDPGIDARCAMFLYRMEMDKWEAALRSGQLRSKNHVKPKNRSGRTGHGERGGLVAASAATGNSLKKNHSSSMFKGSS